MWIGIGLYPTTHLGLILLLHLAFGRSFWRIHIHPENRDTNKLENNRNYLPENLRIDPHATGKIDGRETLVFSFIPRPDATFADTEKYIAQLRGELRIDAQDRIVTRLVGWPVGTLSEDAPAVHVEMMRLPQHGIWLPHIARFNGADYPKLFDGVTFDSASTFSDYIRFSSEIKDVKVEPPSKQ